MSAEVRRFECNEAEARALTEDIRRGVERVHLLLVRSYEWGAWRALGYVSWRDYAMTEFRMSKSRAYELLDQARVIKEIESAGFPNSGNLNAGQAAGSGIPEINAGQAAELAPIVREHGAEAAAAVLSAVVDSGAKPTAAAIRARAEDEGLRPRRTVSDEIVEDAVRVRVTEEPPARPRLVIPDDPARKAAEARESWLRKLRDAYADALLGIDTVTHPNNVAETLDALAAYPVDPMFNATGPGAVRARAQKLHALADMMEAQQ